MMARYTPTWMSFRYSTWPPSRTPAPVDTSKGIMAPPAVDDTIFPGTCAFNQNAREKGVQRKSITRTRD